MNKYEGDGGKYDAGFYANHLVEAQRGLSKLEIEIFLATGEMPDLSKPPIDDPNDEDRQILTADAARAWLAGEPLTASSFLDRNSPHSVSLLGETIVFDFDKNQLRDYDGRWVKVPGSGLSKKLTDDFKKLTHQDVADLHHEMHGKKKKWTASQAKALNHYASDGHKPMNQALRGKIKPDAKTTKAISDAKAGLRPTSRDIRVYRGTGPSQFGVKSTEELKQHIGEVFHDPAFASTSVNRVNKVISGSPLRLEIEVPKGTPGAYIADISNNPGEQEFLLGPDLHYELIEVKETAIGDVARLRVVPKPKATEEPAHEVALDPAGDADLPKPIEEVSTPEPQAPAVTAPSATPSGKPVVPAIIYKKPADGTIVGQSASGDKQMRWDEGRKKFVVEKRQDDKWAEESSLAKGAAYNELKKPGAWFAPQDASDDQSGVSTPTMPDPTPVAPDPTPATPDVSSLTPSGAKIKPSAIYAKHGDGDTVAQSADGAKRMRWDAGRKKFIVEQHKGDAWVEESALSKGAAYNDTKEPDKWFEPGTNVQADTAPKLELAPDVVNADDVEVDTAPAVDTPKETGFKKAGPDILLHDSESVFTATKATGQTFKYPGTKPYTPEWSARNDYVDEEVSVPLNRKLRQGKPLGPNQQQIADVMDATIAKYQTEYDAEVFRGLRISDDLLGSWTTPGTTVTDPAFMSTATSREMAERSIQTNNGAPAMMRLLVPKGTNAAPGLVDTHNNDDGAGELVLGRNTSFQIVDAKKDENGRWDITATVLSEQNAKTSAENEPSSPSLTPEPAPADTDTTAETTLPPQADIEMPDAAPPAEVAKPTKMGMSADDAQKFISDWGANVDLSDDDRQAIKDWATPDMSAMRGMQTHLHGDSELTADEIALRDKLDNVADRGKLTQSVKAYRVVKPWADIEGGPTGKTITDRGFQSTSLAPDDVISMWGGVYAASGDNPVIFEMNVPEGTPAFTPEWNKSTFAHELTLGRDVDMKITGTRDETMFVPGLGKEHTFKVLTMDVTPRAKIAAPDVTPEHQAYWDKYGTKYQDVTLTDAERGALDAYTMNGFGTMNAIARGDVGVMSDPEIADELDAWDEIILGFDGVIKKMPPLQEDITVFRGVGSEHVPASGGWKEKGFTSASWSQSFAKNWADDESNPTVVEFRLKKGQRALMGTPGPEAEVILPLDTKYRVVSETMQDGRRHVIAEVDDAPGIPKQADAPEIESTPATPYVGPTIADYAGAPKEVIDTLRQAYLVDFLHTQRVEDRAAELRAADPVKYEGFGAWDQSMQDARAELGWGPPVSQLDNALAALEKALPDYTVRDNIRRRITLEATNERMLTKFVSKNNLGEVTPELKADLAKRTKEAFAGKKVAVRVTPKTVEHILNSGRLKSQFESGSSKGKKDIDMRASIERLLFDIQDKPWQNTEKRPIYGYVAVDGIRPAGIGSGSLGDPSTDQLTQYGQVQIVLKDSVRERTTAMFGDSLNNMNEGVPSPIDDPDWKSFMASQGGVTGKGLEGLDRSGDSAEFRAGSYAEAQIHGGVGVEDIEEIVFPNNPTATVKKQLDDAGIPYRVLTFKTAADGSDEERINALRIARQDKALIESELKRLDEKIAEFKAKGWEPTDYAKDRDKYEKQLKVINDALPLLEGTKTSPAKKVATAKAKVAASTSSTSTSLSGDNAYASIPLRDANFSDDERAAVDSYVISTGYEDINTALRNANGNTSAVTTVMDDGVLVRDRVAQLDDTLKKSELKSSVQLNRFVDLENIFGGDAQKNLTGKSFVDHAFISTTTLTPDQFSAAHDYEDELDGVPMLNITAEPGVHAIAIGEVQGDNEVLLERGLTFEITNDHKIKGRRVLDVTVKPRGSETPTESTPFPPMTETSTPKKAINSLNDAVDVYQGDGHDSLNKSLRSGTPLNEYDQKLADTLDAGMTPADKPFTAYRGMDIADFFKLFPKGLGVGKTFTSDAYMSTGDKDMLKQFKKKMTFEINVPAGTPHIDVQQALDSSEHDGEKLLTRGLTFRVDGLKSNHYKISVVPNVDEDAESRVAAAKEKVAKATPKQPEVPKIESTPSVKLTAAEETELTTIQSQLSDLFGQSGYWRTVEAEVMHKSGTGKILTPNDFAQSDMARKQLKKLRDAATPLAERELELRMKRDGDLFGEVDDANAERWAAKKKPSSVMLPGNDPAKIDKIADSYRVNDKKTTEHNASIRSGDPSQAAKSWQSRMKRMINSQQLTNDAIVYRGAALRPERIMELRPGSVMIDPGSMSTDEDKGSAEFYMKTRLGDLPGTLPTMFEIRAPKGMPAADVHYGEYVFDFDTPMRIISTKRENGVVHVVAELVTPGEAKALYGAAKPAAPKSNVPAVNLNAGKKGTINANEAQRYQADFAKIGLQPDSSPQEIFDKAKKSAYYNDRSIMQILDAIDTIKPGYKKTISDWVKTPEGSAYARGEKTSTTS